MNRGFANVAIIIALVVIVGGAGWWYLNQSSAPATSEATQLSAFQENVNTGTQATSTGTLFSHPTDGYTFTYDANKLEARATSGSDFSSAGFLPSAVVTSGGGYVQEEEILTYRGTIEAAQEAFIGAYRKHFSPQVVKTENVTINGSSARIVTWKVSPTAPEVKMYLIAYRPNEPRTIVVAGGHNVVATIKLR